MKNDSLSIVTFDVQRLDYVMANVQHLAEVTDIWVVLPHFKNMQFLAATPVVADGLIARSKFHVAPLALAVVVEYSVVTPPVLVTEWLSRVAGKKKDQGVLSGRTYASALLAAVGLMQLAPFVQATDLE